MEALGTWPSIPVAGELVMKQRRATQTATPTRVHSLTGSSDSQLL